MTEVEQGSPTALGKIISFLLILGLFVSGGYLLFGRKASTPGGNTPQAQPASNSGPNQNPNLTPPSNNTPKDDKPEIVETKTEVPKLPPAGIYQIKNNIIEVEISEYAGYAGLIVANGGMEPSENSIFFKKHGFKVKLTATEEESWPALNSGKLAASATTADVLAVYGRQFQIVVPAQIGFSRGADGVIVRKDIRRINALKGKVLVTAQFTEAEFFIRYLAQESGLPVTTLPDLNARPDPNKLNLVFAADAFDAGDVFLADLQSGGNTLAGCVTWAPKTTEVAEKSGGKAHILTTNRNLLIVGDILVVNKGFAQQNPKIVAGLVDGLLEGNRMVRQNPDAHLETIARGFKAFNWDKAKAKAELANVHFSNLPENLAFFSGSIDSAGSFGGIYQSAVLVYGSLIGDPVDAERFVDTSHLKALEKSGAYKDEKLSIAPIRSTHGASVEALLSKDIRFLFAPGSEKLDMTNGDNLKNLESIKQLMQVSPGSNILLRGHVDDARKKEFLEKGGEAFVMKMALSAMDLSKRRAAEIKRLLVETMGVDKDRLDVVGRGWEEPAGETSEEKRRVEVQLFTIE
jgi:NitT/TauT family transport system substrate-binding protein